MSPPSSEARGATPGTNGPFFVVGLPRSGTTLTRLMLDSHPRLAVPPESHFVARLAYRRLRLKNRPEVALERILEHPRFKAWDLDEDRVREFVAAARPATFTDVVRAVFGAYAAEHGKPRWGDKTPGYVRWITRLHRMFPDAVFIHVIRDGREVTKSISERPWSPGLVSAAFWWRRYVRLGRAAGARLGPTRYMEVRLEHLISDPPAVLEEICAFLGEAYDPAMLDYPATARERIRRIDGLVFPPHHHNLEKPPTAGLRDWRAGLAPGEIRAVEAACYPMLRTLGFPAERPAIASRVYARWRWLVELPPRVLTHVRLQLSPETTNV